jgi:hypothetical protein
MARSECKFAAVTHSHTRLAYTGIVKNEYGHCAKKPKYMQVEVRIPDRSKIFKTAIITAFNFTVISLSHCKPQPPAD